MSRLQQVGPASGFVFRVERARGPQWYAKWREPGGRQVKRRIGPAWTRRGRPAPGYFTKRTAEEWLRAILMELDALALAGAELDVTFAAAAREWLRYVEEDRAVKPTTLRNYRCSVERKLLPAFGEMRLRDITPTDLERFRSSLTVSPRTKNKLMIAVGGIYRRAARVYGIAVNPAAQVEAAARAAAVGHRRVQPRRGVGARARRGR